MFSEELSQDSLLYGISSEDKKRTVSENGTVFLLSRLLFFEPGEKHDKDNLRVLQGKVTLKPLKKEPFFQDLGAGSLGNSIAERRATTKRAIKGSFLFTCNVK